MKRLLLIVVCMVGFPQMCGAQWSTTFCPQPFVRPAHQCTRPTLTIDRNPFSPGSQRFVSAFRANPEFRQWLESRYCVHWREVIWAPDLPRFHRQGRPALHGFSGHDDLQRALTERSEPAVDVAPIVEQEPQDWVTHPELTDALSGLGDEFDAVTNELSGRLDQVESDMHVSLEHLHGEQTMLSQQVEGVLQVQTELLKSSQSQAETINQVSVTHEEQKTVLDRLHERVESIRSNRVIQTGFNLAQILIAAGVIGGGGFTGWGAWKLGKIAWRWIFPKKSEPTSDGECPLCPQKDAEIRRLTELLNQARQAASNRRPPAVEQTSCTACAAKDEQISQLESDNRALRIEVQEYRNQPPPTERIIRVPDDSESRLRRAMEIVRREFPTTPSYENYRILIWKHYDLLKSGDGVSHA